MRSRSKLPGDEAHRIARARVAVRQDQMAHDEPSLCDAAAVADEISNLAVHLGQSGPADGDVVGGLRVVLSAAPPEEYRMSER